MLESTTQTADGLSMNKLNAWQTMMGLAGPSILRNPSVAVLYEEALKHEKSTKISSTGALIAYSGKKTGRSPQDKRIVDEATTVDDVWWGPVNSPLTSASFQALRSLAVKDIQTQQQLFVIDGYAGWSSSNRMKIRVVCTLAYHALFMHNMLIRPTASELETFGVPDFVVLNAGGCEASQTIEGVTSKTSVALSFELGEMVILGTQYAGEMKKGVFTIMHYFMPKAGILSLHSSANEGIVEGDTTLFFGLSGTGKTTLSADRNRKLIGDDEHCWGDEGIFNIEGGCYAKCIDLSRDTEPDIFDAIRFGALLENVAVDKSTREVNYHDCTITENTRAAYPIEHIRNAKIPCIGSHPKNIIMLTCDAFGVLPPVSKLSTAQAMYHFMSGYTAKIAGTEVGISEPTATFSSCFGQPFLVWHPVRYAKLLAEKLQAHDVHVWLVNTGWTGGAYGQGKRMPLAVSRGIIDAIHSGQLARDVEEKGEYDIFPVFQLKIPRHITGIPETVLNPTNAWIASGRSEAFMPALLHLASLFTQNFEQFTDKADSTIIQAGPSENAVQ